MPSRYSFRSSDRSRASDRWEYLRRPAPPMGYVPGLDGIRAIAVLGVLFFHGSASWLPGGFLGVDVFFVLSGFLISTLLFEQLAARGRIDFRTFYLHRARRLLPALLAMISFAAVLVALFAHDAAAQFRRSVLPSLLYVANWAFIGDKQSYFEAIGRPPILQHLWSLAIEEQFYLLWPLLLFLLYRGGGRLRVGRFALSAALVSTLLMAFLALLWNMPHYADASRLYFGTDTHAMSLLVGAGLAAFFRPGAMPRTLPPARRYALTGVGVAALGVVLLCYLHLHERGSFLYLGGFGLFAVAAAVLVAVTAHPAALLGPALAAAPLRYLGTRSYGIYLYHWPLFVVMRPGLDVPTGPIPTFIMQVALTLGVAELSYRYLEVPVRRGTFLPTLRAWFGRAQLPRRRVLVTGAIVATAGVVVVTVIMNVSAPTAQDFLRGRTELNAAPIAATAPRLGVSTAPSPPAAQPSASTGDRTAKPSATSEVTATAASSATPSGASAPDAGQSASPAGAGGGGAVTAQTPMTMVGDSLSVGVADDVAGLMPHTTVDAAVGRQADEVFARIADRKAAGLLDPVVVIQTGTNGVVEEDQLRATLSSLSDRQRVVLLTSFGPHDWQSSASEVIRRVARDYRNVRVADFAQQAANHGDWFVEDGVHLTEPGATDYAHLVADTAQAP